MCYPCLNYCENCRQKYIYCPECGAQNFVVIPACNKCGHEFTEEDRAEGLRQWKIRVGIMDEFGNILDDSERKPGNRAYIGKKIQASDSE